MAIQITVTGSRDGVARHVDEFSAEPNAPEAPSLPAIKAFIKSEIESLPAEFNGCTLTFTGQVQPGFRRTDLTLVGQKLKI